MTMLDLKDKRVLLTGAASGLGRELAKLYASQGAQLFLLDKDEPGLRETMTSIGGQGNMIVFDLENVGAIPEMLEKETYNRIDILFNCAAYEVDGWIDDTPIEEFKKNMDVNVFACMSLAQRLLPNMKEKRFGQIINVSSDMSKRSVPGRSSYCMSKSALSSFSDALRMETRPYGIDSITVYPCVMSTPFFDNIKRFGRMVVEYQDPRSRLTPEESARYIFKRVNKRRLVVSKFRPIKLFILFNLFFPLISDKIIARKFNLKNSNL